MRNNQKVYRAPAWHTAMFVIFGALLFGGGLYLSWLFFQGRNQTIGLLLFFMLFLPITLTGAYFIYTALRHKVIVDNDEITIFEGAFGEKSFNISQVEGYVRRGSNQMLEVKVTEEQEKTTIQTAVKVDESLRQVLYLNKEVPQYKQTNFKVSNYPVTLEYSLINRAINIILFAYLGYIIFPVFANFPNILDKVNDVQGQIGVSSVLIFVTLILFLLFHKRHQLIFNLGVTLYDDRIEVKGIFSNKVIHRDNITYFCYRRLSSNPLYYPTRVQISTEPNADYYSKAYYLKTFGEFEDEPLFVDWFNSLQVPTDMEIPRIRQEY